MYITALCGGVGGAKLALGLNQICDDLCLIVNTGDDFIHYGLLVCPDIDTVLYTLSGRANAAQGWGRESESFAVLNELGALAEDNWFMLGDKDIALHLLRAKLRDEEKNLSQIIEVIGNRLGLKPCIIPMSDAPSPSMIETDIGTLPFQDYFVRHRCAPITKAVHYAKTDTSPAALSALAEADAIIVCPSNPLLSISPILETNGIRAALESRTVPSLAVSPIVDGAAVKGPTAKMFAEMGSPVTGASVVRHYRGLIDIFVLDESDHASAGEIEDMGVRVIIAPTLMHNLADKERLASLCVSAIEALPLRAK